MRRGFRPRSESAQPAGLYLHVPFCSAICPYCDFAVTTGDRSRRARFVDDLLVEIELYAGTPATFDTIYLGGGTPSSLSPEEIGRLLAALRRTFDFAAGTSVSLEANPEDVDAAVVEEWRSLGIDRLSLGLQSFDDSVLRFLGRRHDGADSRRALELARRSALPSVSADLIYALPGFHRRTWLDTLAQAADLDPHHLSCYELTIHRGTRFGSLARSGRMVELGEGDRACLFTLTHETLHGLGYEGYEVSSFARGSAHEARHNRKYWQHVPYLGLGPSAHSFDGTVRWWNERRRDTWAAKVRGGELPVAGAEVLKRSDLALEAVMLAMRTRRGLDLTAFEERFGHGLRRRNAATIARLVEEALVIDDGERWRPTLRGLALADRLAVELDLGPDV